MRNSKLLRSIKVEGNLEERSNIKAFSLLKFKN